jgi:hypothetical protein
MRRLVGEVPGEAVNRRRDYGSNGSLSILLVMAGAGPSPIGRRLAELATDWVLVDVGHRGLNGLHGAEIPIITSAFLPESKTPNPGPLQDRQAFQERAPHRLQVPLDPSGKRGLQRFQEEVHADVMGRGLNEDVDVLRHENVGDQPA